MKLSEISLTVLVLLTLSTTCVTAAPVGDANDDNEDIIEDFIEELLDALDDILEMLESSEGISAPVKSPDNPNTEFSNSEYSVVKPIPDQHGKTNTAPSFVATAFTGLLKAFLGKDPQLARLAADATNPNLIKYVTEMIDGDKVSDLVQLALKSPNLRELYTYLTKSMPLFSHLEEVVEKTSLQDRVLGETLMDKNASAGDLATVTRNDVHYSMKTLMKAIENDKEFGDFLALTLNKSPDVHQALKMLTGENLPQSGGVNPLYTDKYSATSSDITKNKKLVDFGTAILFGFENFQALLDIVKEFTRSDPNLAKIVSGIFRLNTSMFKALDPPQQGGSK